MNKYTTCKYCIMHSGIPGITIDKDGVCSDCNDFVEEQKVNNETAAVEYTKKMEELFEKVKSEKHVYDAIVLFSGGKDSTELVNIAKNRYGLNILGFGMQLPIGKPQAVANMDEVAKRIGFDLMKMSIPLDTYKRYMKFALMNSDKYDLGENIGCAACSFIFRWYAYRLAIEMNIPIILDGRDKWQNGGFLFESGDETKEKALKGEKVFSRLHDLAQDALGTTKGLMGYDIEYFKDKNFPSFIAPFTFMDYNTMDSLKTIDELGLNKNDFETMYTNCDGVYLFDYITLKRFDCTSYHKGYAHGLRNKIPTLTQLKTDESGNDDSFMLTREQTMTVLDEYKKALFYMAEHSIDSAALTDEVIDEIIKLTPFSLKLYGEKGARMLVKRFTFMKEYADFFDINLLDIKEDE